MPPAARILRRKAEGAGRAPHPKLLATYQGVEKRGNAFVGHFERSEESRHFHGLRPFIPGCYQRGVEM
jgi:hypothetical protein